MKTPRHSLHTDGGVEVTALMIDIFRANGGLLAAGDRLVADLGLTSARWQVLGSIALSDHEQPVSRLARVMGLTRQAVQRVVNDLAAEGLVAFAPNPHHKRAQLVVLTQQGRDAYDVVSAREAPWSNALASGLSVSDVAVARRVLSKLIDNLEDVPDRTAKGD